MKIDLNLTIDGVSAINRQLQRIYDMPVTTVKIENVYKSIGYDLADKFDKKVKTHLKKTSLFDQNKRLKLSLKFHEAWALLQILTELIKDVENHYQAVLLGKAIHALDQKIC